MEKENTSKPNEEVKAPGKRQMEEDLSMTSKKVRLEQEEESSLQEPNAPNSSTKVNRNRVAGNVFKPVRGFISKIGHSQGKEEFYIEQRLQSIAGPTLELDSIEFQEVPFSSRNRLYVGNMTSEMTKEKLKTIFKPYGEINDIFINVEKNFGFVKMDLHENAVKAKRALDGSIVNGRLMRVRFAPSQSIVRVRNLSRYVSNELLHKSFEIFGAIERAVVTVDDRGNPKGEGIVEFAMRSSALACLRICQERCYYLTAEMRPCIVEPMEINDDNDGLPEKMISKLQTGFTKDRSIGPRFADPDSFEHEYGNKWKRIMAYYNNMELALKRGCQFEEQKLEAELEYARTMRETELLRKELKQREADGERRKLELQMRHKQSQQLIMLETAASIRHQPDLLAPIRHFSHERSSGFGGICDYDARNTNLNSSPFVVFGDRNDNFQEEIDLTENSNVGDINYNSVGSDSWNMSQSAARRSID